MRIVRTGATIVEYLMIALACLSVVISVLFLTGQGFNIRLSGLLADMKGHATAAITSPVDDKTIVVPDPSDPDYDQYFLIKDITTGKTTLVKFNPDAGKVILVSGSRGVELVFLRKVLAGEFDQMTPKESAMLHNLCTLSSLEQFSLPPDQQTWQCYGEAIQILESAPNAHRLNR